MVAEYYRIIPHFPLNPASTYKYYDLLFIKGAGLCSTLIITAYLITTIKDRIEERGRKVKIELSKYKSLDKIKSSFILQVTHEIRGPLAALKGFHEMILKGITGETSIKTKDAIHKANRRTENLLTMVDEMIDYAYMQAEEEVQYSKAEFRVRDIIDANLDVFSGLANEKGLQFTSSCSKDLTFITNRDLMNIMLNNLISNAIRYSPEKSIITVNAEKHKDNIHIIIKDEGMGIEPDELDKIFEEFYRTRRAREIERDGTGLGLPIVQKAVEALGGKITVYSEEGKGTTFHIYFPISSPIEISDKKHLGGNNEKR
jgi:signal transduction histidine kinase